MLQQSARGCFQIAQRFLRLPLRPACASRQHPVHQALHLSMAQKSITSFFKGPEKRKGTDDSAPGVDKKQKVGIAVAAALSKDGEATAAAADKTATTASEDKELPPAPKLSTEELRALANRAIEIAGLRVEQAKALGVPPKLEDLLIDESWRKALGGEFSKPYMRKLNEYLSTEWQQHSIYPPQQLIFRAFNSGPIDQVRVVIIGQDPYHNTGQAMGLSFSVPPGKAVPSSLQNIYKELLDDCACTVPKHGDLEKWSHQGVFLLNAVLTVRAHDAASHGKQGWEGFTDAAISTLSARRKGLVFLLWGRYAQQKAALIDSKKHHILKAAHPSGFSANKGFFGCRHFSKANDYLKKEGLLPVDWQIDPIT